MNNSFKELEKEHLQRFEKKSPEIKQNIEGTTSSYKFIGDVLDLYFTKIMNVFVAMTGGDMSEQTNKEPNKNNPAD